MSHLFISYSRNDIEFAEKIVKALAENDLDTWIDWKSIPKGEYWEQEIYKGIENADAFLFLISPDSVQSEMCNKEISHAVCNSKRILPIFIADVEDREIYRVTEKFLLPETKDEICKRNFIKCRPNRDNLVNVLEEIKTTVHTDYEWLQYHTRLQVKALEWERHADQSRLLRGSELHEAEQRLANLGIQKEPQPTALQRQYLLASQRNQTRIRMQITFGLAFGSVLLVMLSILTWQQRDAAVNSQNTAVAEANTRATALINEEHARATAQAEKARAEEQAKIAHARELAALAQTNIDKNYSQSLLLALESYKLLENSTTLSAVLSALESNSNLEYFLSPGNGIINEVAYSPDGKLLAAATANKTIVLWDVSKTGRPVLLSAIPAHSDEVSSLGFNADGSRMASGSNDNSVIVWDLSDPARPQTLATLKGHSNRVRAVAFSPDNHVLASSGNDGQIILWDILDPASPKLLKRIEIPNYALTIAFSRDGRTLVSGSYANITFWDVSDPSSPLSVSSIEDEQTNWIRNLSFNPDGTYLASSSDDHTIMLWDVKNVAHPVKLGQLSFDVWVNSVKFSPVAQMLATGGNDGKLKFWDISDPSDPRIINEFMGYGSAIWSIAFSVDGNQIAAGGDEESVAIWSLASLPMNRMVKATLKNDDDINSVAFDPSGSLLASSSYESISFWDTRDLKQIQKLNTFQSHKDYYVKGILFSPDGRLLASPGDDGHVEIWDVSQPELPVLLNDLSAHSRSVFKLALDPRRNLLVSGSWDGTVILWDLTDSRNARKLATISNKNERVNDVAMNSSGSLLAVASEVGTVPLWDIKDPTHPQLISTLNYQPSSPSLKRIAGLAFSPDDKTLIAGSWNSIAVFDVTDPSRPALFGKYPANGAWVYALAFSKDGSMLVSASNNGAIVLWDSSDRSALQSLVNIPAHTDQIYSVDISPDGKTLVSGSWDDTISFWDLDPAFWLEKACQVAGRNLTQTEWQQYFHGEAYHSTCLQWMPGK